MNADKDDMWWEEVMRFLVFFAFFLMSCGKDAFFTDHVIIDRGKSIAYEVDPEIEPFFQEYRDLTGRRVSNISAVFGETATEEKPNVIGYCTFYSNRPAIVVQRRWWDNAIDNDERFLLIAHELGHCDLLRDHLDENIEKANHSIPESIMGSYIGLDLLEAYKKHKQYYIDELLREDVDRIR